MGVAVCIVRQRQLTGSAAQKPHRIGWCSKPSSTLDARRSTLDARRSTVRVELNAGWLRVCSGCSTAGAGSRRPTCPVEALGARVGGLRSAIKVEWPCPCPVSHVHVHVHVHVRCVVRVSVQRTAAGRGLLSTRAVRPGYRGHRGLRRSAVGRGRRRGATAWIRARPSRPPRVALAPRRGRPGSASRPAGRSG